MKKFLSYLFLFLFNAFCILNAADPKVTEYYQNLDDIQQQLSNFSIHSSHDGYDSDSEAEDDYPERFKKAGYRPELGINPDDFLTQRLTSGYETRIGQIFLRGINIDSADFDRSQRSAIRRKKAGDPVYAAAVYNQAHLRFGDENIPGNGERLAKASESVLQTWNMLPDLLQRNALMNYVNSGKIDFLFSGNPFISTSDCQAIDSKTSRYHVLAYAWGEVKATKAKNLEKSIPQNKKFDEIYDENGRPKRPYIGMVEVVFVPYEKLKGKNSLYILNEYLLHKDFKISRGNIHHREVTFVSDIEGKYIACRIPIRWPSFESEEYKTYYASKYGIDEQAYKSYRILLKDEDSRIAATQQLRNLLHNKSYHDICGVISRIRYFRDDSGNHFFKVLANNFDGTFVEEGLQMPATAVRNKRNGK